MQGPIEGRIAFEQAVRALMAQAADAPWPWLCCVDADFADWPLGERAVVDQLGRWIGPGTTLVLLAARFDDMARRHARFALWRQSWGHRIECRLAHEDDVACLPRAALVPGVQGLVMHDTLRHRGQWLGPGASLQSRVETVQGLLARSNPGWPITTLGL